MARPDDDYLDDPTAEAPLDPQRVERPRKLSELGRHSRAKHRVDEGLVHGGIEV